MVEYIRCNKKEILLNYAGHFFEVGETQQCNAYNCHAVGFLFLLMMVINAIVFNHTI